MKVVFNIRGANTLITRTLDIKEGWFSNTITVQGQVHILSHRDTLTLAVPISFALVDLEKV